MRVYVHFTKHFQATAVEAQQSSRIAKPDEEGLPLDPAHHLLWESKHAAVAHCTFLKRNMKTTDNLVPSPKTIHGHGWTCEEATALIS